MAHVRSSLLEVTRRRAPGFLIIMMSSLLLMIAFNFVPSVQERWSTCLSSAVYFILIVGFQVGLRKGGKRQAGSETKASAEAPVQQG